MSYLDELGLPQDQVDKLAQFSARTPFALLGLIRASHEAFVKFMGDDVAARVEERLVGMLSAEELKALEGPPPRQPLGAVTPQGKRGSGKKGSEP